MMNSGMRLLVSIASLYWIVGCGKKENVDYSAKALTETTLVVDKIDAVIGLPDTMKEASTSTDNRKEWEPTAGMFAGPTVTLSTSYDNPQSLEDAVKAAQVTSGFAVTRKEKVGEAFLVSAQSSDKGGFTVSSWVPADADRTLKCTASWISPSGEIQNVEAQRAWAEKLCSGARPKNPVAKVTVTPEMTDFLSQFGTGVSVGKALTKYGAKGLKTQDMELYDLKEPKITRAATNGPNTCYTVSAKAGVTTRTYELCWQGSKIVEVKDRGMH